jgi:hypothetical protein
MINIEDLMFGVRKDQLRDKDTINRQAIVALITGDCKISIESIKVHGSDRVYLAISEKDSSPNENPKFIFIFNSFDCIGEFRDTITRALIEQGFPPRNRRK